MIFENILNMCKTRIKLIAGLVLVILTYLALMFLGTTDFNFSREGPYSGIALAGLATRTSYVAGATITASQANTNENSLLNAVNNINNSQIEPAAGIIDTKLATITTAGKVNSSSFIGTIWDVLSYRNSSIDDASAQHSHTSIPFASMTGTITAAQHGDLSASTATMHSASSSLMSDPTGVFNSTNVEGALAEFAAGVGYNAAATSATTTAYVMYYGFCEDMNSQYPTLQPSCDIAVATNTAPNGIVANITVNYSNIAVTNVCTLGVPLRINGVDQSTASAHKPRWANVIAGNPGAPIGGNFTTSIVYRPGDGWTAGASNTVSIGLVYGGPGSIDCTGSLADSFTMSIYGLK